MCIDPLKSAKGVRRNCRSNRRDSEDRQTVSTAPEVEAALASVGGSSPMGSYRRRHRTTRGSRNSTGDPIGDGYHRLGDATKDSGVGLTKLLSVADDHGCWVCTTTVSRPVP